MLVTTILEWYKRTKPDTLKTLLYVIKSLFIFIIADIIYVGLYVSESNTSFAAFKTFSYFCIFRLKTVKARIAESAVACIFLENDYFIL